MYVEALQDIGLDTTFGSEEFDEFLFATGDRKHWLHATAAAVTGADGESWYSNAPRPVLASSLCAGPHQVRWFRREDCPEDPWVSLRDNCPQRHTLHQRRRIVDQMRQGALKSTKSAGAS